MCNNVIFSSKEYNFTWQSSVNALKGKRNEDPRIYIYKVK